jgi:site-specific recombinase XerD
MNATTLDSWAETFSNILGVPFYWHSLRHFFTTECSRSGLPDDVIQMLIGWNDISMVQVYKDIDADEQFEKYFNEDGIQKQESKSLSDM